MKKGLLFIFIVLCGSKVFAQSDLHCATDEMQKKVFLKKPFLKSIFEQREVDKKNKPGNDMSSASYTIPLVFHILHLGGPENISDNQVIDGVHILNRDYAKENSDTVNIISSFKALADSTGIQFVLATKDPNGNCTNGIVHYYDIDADWNEASPTLYSHTWDPTMYLNVYIVRTITLASGFGAAGYTYFPGSFAPGDPMDAIVVLNNYFGSIGTGTAFQSRVLTHEVGHWLNLYHVFGYNGAAVDCNNDDYVSDTPTTPGYVSCPDASIPSSYQLCTPGIDENFQNYMDYSYCCKMFTQGQGQRMRDALNDNIAGRDNLWSTSNLIATGVINPSSVCSPIADFNYNRSVTCVGTPVTFNDASWNGQPTTYNWSFPSGIPATSTSPNPTVVYSATGIYSATLTTSNVSGTSAPVTKSNIITVTNNIAAFQSGWAESFENFPLPNNDWTLTNSSGGVNWEQSSDAAYTGIYSAKLPSENNTRNSITSMISPSINLSTIINPELTFKVAAAEINPNHINKLQVFSSTDCEETWTEIYSKVGASLVTTVASSDPFIPLLQSEWRTESISLSSIVSASSVNFKFVYTRDTISTPSNIFIDDINVLSFTGLNKPDLNKMVSIYPNPSEGSTNIELMLSKEGHAKISLFDVAGRAIELLHDSKLSSGKHRFVIGQNYKLSKGIYFVCIIIDKQSITKKIVIR